MASDKSILKSREIQDRALLKTAKRVLKVESDAVASLARRLGADFSKTVHALSDGEGRLIITGMGKSGLFHNIFMFSPYYINFNSRISKKTFF